MAPDRNTSRVTGVQYTIDHSNGACSIDPLSADAQGFDASLNITRGTLSMRSPLQLFNLLNDSQYVGQRTVRGGQQADVFQRLTDQLPGHGLVVYEVYFLNVSYSRRMSPAGCEGPKGGKVVFCKVSVDVSSICRELQKFFLLAWC